MRCRFLVVVGLAVLLAPLGAQRPGPPLRFDDLLAALTDLDALGAPIDPAERCVQFSSYDRRSDAGPGDPEAWYANGDAGQFLREVDRGGRTEYVMVDAAGPGAVVRIWSANPHGRLRFYFDREPTPRYTVGFADLLGGELPGLGEPLCGMRARGGNCHVPFPFAEHLEITSDAGDFYYQVNVRTFGAGRAVESFEPRFLTERRAAIDAAAARLARSGGGEIVGDAVATARFGVRLADDARAADGTLWSWTRTGPGVVRALRVRLTPVDGSVPASTLGRAVRVRVVCDGEPTVDVPFADFFGSAPALRPWHGLALGVRPDGFAYCDFPQPFAESIELSLVSDGALPAASRLDGEVVYESRAVPEGALRFHATYDAEFGRRTRPFGDHTVLDATGAGRYVGTTLVVRNPTKAWWGEGDEKIRVDGEAFPSTFGTGTEDYFGYAWCCPERFDHPLHAQPQADGPANFGYTCNVRLQIADRVPFTRSLRFDLEVWHWQDVAVDYATVAYWYGERGARARARAMPPVAERMPIAMEPPVSFVAADVFEGEALQVLKRSGGRTEVQDLSGFSGSRWSRDAHLWWVDPAPGDELVLAVPVGAAGRYRVQAALTTARDYAIVKIAIDGVPLGEPIDLFSRDVRSTGLVELGIADLSAGTSRLSIEIVGHAPGAVPRHMFGLDYLKLVPIE